MTRTPHPWNFLPRKTRPLPQRERAHESGQVRRPPLTWSNQEVSHDPATCAKQQVAKAPKRAGCRRSRIAAFLETAEGKLGKREIARAFNIKGNDKIGLKALLKEMAQEGLSRAAGRRLRRTGMLPPSPSSRSPATTATASFTACPSTGRTMKAPRRRC